MKLLKMTDNSSIMKGITLREVSMFSICTTNVFLRCFELKIKKLFKNDACHVF